MSDTPIHKAFNGKWKWVEALQPVLVTLLSIIQGLVIYIWSQHIEAYEAHAQVQRETNALVEQKLDNFAIFEAETKANRFTSQDALRMNALLLEAINDLEDELKRCIRTQDC